MSKFIQIFLRYFVPGALIIVVGAWFIIESERQHRLNDIKAEQRMAVGLGAQALLPHIQMLVADMEYLRRNNSVQDMATASTPQNVSRLQAELANFIRSRKIYDSVRWVDAKGDELTRVELYQGQAQIAPATALRHEQDEAYFKVAMASPPGKLYLSRLSLNVEHQEIERPFKPTLRLAASIADERGETRGLLVLNYLGDEMLRHFEATTHTFGNQFSLLDGAGYWLHAVDPQDEWGFMVGDTARSLPVRHPEAWSRFQDMAGQFELADGLWTFETVQPLETHSPTLQAVDPMPYRWIIVSYLHQEQLLTVLPRQHQRIWLAIGSLVILLAIGSTLLARQQQREQSRELRYQAIFDNALVGMATSSPDKRWLTVNPALCHMLGYTADALQGRLWTELTHPDDLSLNLAAFEATLNGQQPSYSMRKRLIRADGSAIYTDITSHLIRRPDGSPDYFVTILEDVTARQEAEQENDRFSHRANVLLELPKLAEARDEPQFMQAVLDRLEALTESKIGFIHFINDDGLSIELVTWSSATLTQGCKAAPDRHYPIDEAGIWADAARTKTPLIVNDYPHAAKRGVLPDGHTPLMRFICVPIIENGNVKVLMGVGNAARPYQDRDVETAQLLGNETWRIIQRQRSEKALQAAAQVVNASPIVCFRWLAEEGWPVAFVSDNVSQWGYTPADLMAGEPAFADIVHPDDLARIVEEVTQNTAQGKPCYEQEYRLMTRTGEPIWVVDRTRVTRDEAGHVLWYDGVLTDITERKQQQMRLSSALAEQQSLNKRLEEANNQLLQSEKMASIGQLAAGVAHELNNPIGFVHSNLGTLDAYLNDLMGLIETYQQLTDNLGKDHPALERLARHREEIDFDYLRADIFQLIAESKDGLARVKKIVQDLKNFSRVGEQEWQLANLHEGLDSTLNIVWNELKYKCKVVKEYGDLPPTYCLISQLNQVFMNLLVNASHAIEQQGTITIRTRQTESHQLCIEINDTGCGIPKENLTRIFNPFFTTKPVGKGTGLGLSLSYSIVERHHGKIEVESELGVGTTFRILLPHVAAPPAQPDPEETQ